MTKRVSGWRVGFAGLSAWALVVSAGCDQRSDSAKAVDDSARDLHALSGASPEPAMDAEKAKTLGKIATDLAPAIANGDAGEKGAASMLVAQTQAGLGEQAMTEAAEAERNASNTGTQISTYLSNWKMRSAAAGAAETFDPSAQRAEIAKSKQEKDAAIQREQAHRTQVVAQLTELQDKAKAKMDGAAAKETQYGQLMQEAVKLTATQAAPKVEQANKIKREADALRLDGTKLEAQAGAVAPLVTEIDAVISQLTNQKKDLDDSDAAIAKQLAAAKDEASKERAEATKANVELEKLAGTLKQQRSADVEAAYSKAAGYFSKASNAAKDAAAQAPGSGKATMGDVQMCIADLRWHKAQGLKAYAALMESLASANPALPKKGEFAEAGKGARDQAKQELEAAATALESAKQAFTTAKASGDTKAKLTALGELLETAVKVSREETQGVSADLAVLTGKAAAPGAAAPAPAAPEGTPAPAAASDQTAALKSAAEAFIAASQGKKWPELAALINVPEGSRAALASMLQMSEKQVRLDAAFKAKFGKTLKESMAANPMLANAMKQQGLDPDSLANVKPADLQATVNGEQGSVSATGLDKPLAFKNVNGKWLYSDPSIEMMGAQLPMIAPMMANLGTAMDEFAGEVEAGKYPDANAALAAFQAKMMQSMGAGGPPGGPKKGPGGGG